MTDKTYDHIESKQRARNRFKKFIRKHMDELGGPSELTYFCLPGVTAREIIEITDPLGIPRKNIVCMESDKQKFEKIKKLGLGTELYLGSDFDFFTSEDRKFDIISLDYEGSFNPSNLLSLRMIAYKHELKPRGIMMTNFYGKREGHEQKFAYVSPATQKFLDRRKEERILEIKRRNAKIRENPNDNDAKNYDISYTIGYLESISKMSNLDIFRDYGISSNIIDLFLISRGVLSKDLNRIIGSIYIDVKLPDFTCPLYELNPDFGKINDDFKKDLEKNIEKDINLCRSLGINKEWLDKNKNHLNRTKMDLEFDIRCSEKYLEILSNISERQLILMHHNLAKLHDESILKFLQKIGLNKQESRYALNFSKGKENGNYFCKDIERYKYISDAGTPMFSDFFFFDQFRKYFEKYDNLVKFNKENGNITFSYDEDLVRQHYKDNMPKRMEECLKKCMIEYLPKRIFLGSSIKPKLTGEEYYDLFGKAILEGKPKEQFHEELLKEYRTTLPQLRAFEAHVTMGTYGPKPVYMEPETVEEKPKPRVFNLKDIINCGNPNKFYGRLSKDAQLRVKYFLEEDLPYRINLTPEKKQELLNNISESKWYKMVLEDRISDLGIFTFFDDLMLYPIWKNDVPNKETVRNIYEGSRRGLKLPKVYT